MNRKILVILSCVLLTTIMVMPVSGLRINYGNQLSSSQTEDITFSHGRAITKLIQQINEIMLEGYIENLTAFGPRVTGTPGCEQAAKYIYNEFKKMGLETRYQNWTSGAIHGSNVEAALNGVDSSSGSVYVISGHYDGVPESLAAYDNGAGTAAVLAAANVMSQYTFDHTVRFVLFSGEEQGLLGAYAYAKEARKNKDNIIGLLNVDAIGCRKRTEEENEIDVFYKLSSKWISDASIQISQHYQKSIDFEVISQPMLLAISDHFPFWQFGFDSVLYYDPVATSDVHSPEDIIENMNLSYVTQVAKLTTATLAELSSLDFTIDGTTLYVGGSGPGNYSTIQDAIDNSSIGDIVFVYDGTYDEHLTVDKPIDVIGEDKENTIITGAGQEAVVYLSGSWTRLSRFTIRNTGSEWLSAGIDVCSDHNIISENAIVNNQGYGIGLYGHSFNTISGNVITSNKDGIILWYLSTNNMISENTITDNEVCGIALSGGSDYNLISDNIIANNSFGVYFQMGYYDGVKNPCNNIITRNIITNNENGIYLNIMSKENTIFKNDIKYNKQGVFIGTYCDSNIIKKNNFIGNNRHASFDSCFKNRWIRNYWDDQIRLRPKIIVGQVSLPWLPSLKWVNADLLPARQPYKID